MQLQKPEMVTQRKYVTTSLSGTYNTVREEIIRHEERKIQEKNTFSKKCNGTELSLSLCITAPPGELTCFIRLTFDWKFVSKNRIKVYEF